MRDAWAGIAMILMSSSAYAVEPQWCVRSYEDSGVVSLAYFFSDTDRDLMCVDYSKPAFEFKQIAPNTCLFYWWLNVLEDVMPDFPMNESFMVQSVLKKNGKSDWKHKYCYEGMDGNFHTFRSCNNPDYSVYANWEIMKEDVLGFESITFRDDIFGDGIELRPKKFYKAFMRFKEETGCPAMF